jgi:hypothetical protein
MYFSFTDDINKLSNSLQDRITLLKEIQDCTFDVKLYILKEI